MKLYEDLRELKGLLKDKTISSLAFQGIDFASIEDELLGIECQDCLFLGCKISPRLMLHLYEHNYIFPSLNVPHRTYPRDLYTGLSLYEGYDPAHPESYEGCYDKRVYDYYIASTRTPSLLDSLSRTLHDHSISENLSRLLDSYPAHKIVAIMGGHGLSRTSPMFRQIAQLSSLLTERGYLMLSGGGPGAMEATHLGAWLAGRGAHALDEALEILAAAPMFADAGWLETAYEVMRRYPNLGYDSLGIPTWHYGHELATPLATKIAKYFANSIREEGLLAVARGGVIYSPGSAGTMQEIFQDLAQNHYVSYGIASPMIFLGKHYWTENKPIYPLIEELSSSGKLQHILLSISDSNEEIVQELERFAASCEAKASGK